MKLIFIVIYCFNQFFICVYINLLFFFHYKNTPKNKIKSKNYINKHNIKC